MRHAAVEAVVSGEVAERLRAFRSDVMREVPGAVKDFILFGSRARGDAEPDSDYDVVVLMPGTRLTDDVRRRIADTEWEYRIAGLDLQALPLAAEVLEADRTELAMRINLDGIELE